MKILNIKGILLISIITLCLVFCWTSFSFAQTTWKWIAYGDTRTNDDDHRAVLQAIVNNTPDYKFIVNVGDVVETGTLVSDWETWQAACDDVLGGTGQSSVPPKYMSAPGNHDRVDEPAGLTNWNTYLPGQAQQYGNNGEYFVFDYENARFVIMNSDVSTLTGDQYNMMIDAIQNNPKDWLFAFWHHPIFDFGEKVYEDGIHDTWGIPLYQNGCDIFFTGHAHYYVRNKKLELNGDMNPPLDATNGTVQVVTGNGGAPLDNPDPNHDGNGYMVTSYLSPPENGYTELTMDGNTMHLRHILRDGTVFDEADYTPNPKGGGPIMYTLTVNTVGSGSVTLNPAGGSYSEGTVITLTATPDPDYIFSSWSGDLSGSANPETITMNSDKSVTATFDYFPGQRTLTVNTSGNGSVTLDPPGAIYDDGTVVTLTANSDPDWQFIGWNGDLSGSNNPETITMDANKTVTANFAPESGIFELPVSSVIVSAHDGNIPENTLDNDLNTRWSADGDGQWIQYDFGSSYTVAYISIAWYKGDERVYSFDIEVSEDAVNWTQVFSGSSSGSTLQQEDFDFIDTAGRYVRYIGHMNSYNTWNSVAEVDVYGYSGIGPTQYTLTVTTSGSGSVTLDPAGGTYDVGTVVTLTATPDAGWQFDSWSGDLSGTTNPITITMDANKGVTATFSEIPVQYTLTVNTSGSGSVTLDPAGGTYDVGTVVTLTAEPDAGWQFDGWSGDLGGTTNPTTITMDADKNVTATFSTIPAGGDVVFEEVQPGGSSVSATVTSASITGVSGHLYLASVSSKPNRSVNSVSGLGLTWTKVDEQCGGRNQTGVSVWMAQGTPSGNGTVTAMLSSAPTNAVIAVSRYSGVDGSSPIGNIISANTNGVDGSCSGGVDNASYSVNLMTVMNGAVVFGAVAHRNKTHTPGSGYTERVEFHHGSGGDETSVSTMDKTVDSPSTVAVNGTFSGAVDWAVIAVEILPGGGIPTQYTLTVNTSGSGSVTLDPPGGTYNAGTVITLTATPNPGWQFDGWSGDLSGTTNPATITMDANKSVTATFSEIPVHYTLTVNTSGSGSVTFDPPGGIYDAGTVVTLTATPDSGWVFSSWSGDLSGTTNPTTITMDANKSVTATFIEETGEIVELPVSSVTASAHDGNVPENTLDNDFATRWSADGDGQWIQYDLGSSYTVAYVSIAWYKGDERTYSFDIEVSEDASNWIQVFSGNSSGSTLQQEDFDFADTSSRYVRYIGHMNSYNTWNSVTEVDIYGYTGGGPIQYTLTVNTSGSGSVTLDPSGGTYNDGTMVTLTATPDSGWQFNSWSGDLSGSNNPETITMDANKTVTATFTEISGPQQYTLTVNISGTGTVDLNPTGGIYDEGTVVTLTANPGSNWVFSSWSGDLSGTNNPETITMNSDKNVTATFTYEVGEVTGLWSSSEELASAPISGAAWDAVYNAANQSFYPPVVDNQDSDDNIQCLAAAIVYARTGNQTYKNEVVDACEYLATHGAPMDRTLAWAREVGAYALAADLVGYRTTAFETWLRNMAEVWDASDGWTVLEMFYDRPNNWGTHGFGMLVSVYAYLQDTQMLNTIRDYWIQGVTGPNPGYTYGDLSWQANPNDPRQINPTGSVKEGLNIDGVLPDDMRRGGSFSIPPGHTGYCWEALQGLIMAARVLERYDPNLSIWSVDNNALYRAGYILQVVYENDFGGWAATGDDEWMLPFFDDAYGTSWSDGSADEWGAGKNTGWAYVLLGGTGIAKRKTPEMIENAAVIPDEYCLHQNYPNPFNPTTHIQYDLPKAGHITMIIYDMMGRKVSTIVDGFRSSGTYVVEWNAVDSLGRRLPSGIYLCRMQSGSYVRTIKIMLMR